MQAVAGTRPLCSQLSPGAGAPILVADFQPLTTAPRLSGLISAAATDHPVYQVDPRGALSGERLYAALPDLAGETVASFRSGETPADDRRVFVVSHCSAAGLSLRIADLLSGDWDVTAVLVEPTWPGTDHVAERFAEFHGKLGGRGRPCPDLDGDPWSFVAETERLMAEDLTELAARLELSAVPPAFAELRVSYRTWLAFLLACRNDQPAQPPAAAVAVTVLTGDPGFVLPGTDPGRCRITPPPPADRPDAVTPELATAVLDQIGS